MRLGERASTSYLVEAGAIGRYSQMRNGARQVVAMHITGEMADLEEAIRVAKQAVDSTPHDHPDQAARLNSLGNMLESRYKRMGEIKDLEEAIKAAIDWVLKG